MTDTEMMDFLCTARSASLWDRPRDDCVQCEWYLPKAATFRESVRLALEGCGKVDDVGDIGSMAIFARAWPT